MPFPIALGAEIGASVLGSVLGFASANKASKRAARERALDRKMQYDFAQHGIGWKAADARAAGLHPLFAMGAPTISYSPVGGGDDNSGAYLADMGQNISRSISSYRSEHERAVEAGRLAAAAAVREKRETVLFGQQVERNALENTFLAAQIQRIKGGQPGTGPGVGNFSMGGSNVSGAGEGSRVVPLPAQPVVNAPDNAAREAGNITDYSYVRSDRGITIAPSMDIKNRIEDMGIEPWLWSWRNRFNPETALQGVEPPNIREFPLPSGYIWHWNAWAQAFQPYHYLSGRFNTSDAVLNYWRRR